MKKHPPRRCPGCDHSQPSIFVIELGIWLCPKCAKKHRKQKKKERSARV